MKAVILLGILNGATIALTAIGLVLVFRAQKMVNFAHAQLGVLPMLLLGKAVLDWDVNWYVAAVIAVAGGALIGLVCEALVIRPLADRSRTTLLVATIGLANVLTGLSYFGSLGADKTVILAEGYPMPFRWRADIDSLGIGTHHLLTAILVPSIAAGLYLFFKRTTTGKAIRAAASNAEAAVLAGLDVRRLTRITWMIAGCLSTISAVLSAPNVARFDPASLGPGLMLRALAAAALGGFTSFPHAFAAGIGLAVIEQVAIYVTHDSAVGTLVLFVGVIVGLAFRGHKAAAGLGASERLDTAEKPLRVPAAMRTSVLVRYSRTYLVGFALFLVVILPHLPPFRSPTQRFNLSSFMITILAVASISTLAGWSGQITLGHFAFAGIGAFTAGRLADQELSLPLIILLAGGLCAVIAAALGFAVLRHRGLSLAVATLGLAIVSAYWLFGRDWFSGGASAFGSIQREPMRVPGIGELTSVYEGYYVAAVVVAITLLGLSAFRRSPRGRLLIAVRDNEAASAVFGQSATLVKVQAFALTAFAAGIAGVLVTAITRGPSAAQFSPEYSLLYLSVAVVGGLGSITGAVLGTVFILGAPLFFASAISGLFPYPVQFGLFLGGGSMIVSLIANPGGVVSVIRTQWERVLARMAAAREAAPAAVLAPAEASLPLQVEHVTMKFGEFAALTDVSLAVRPGEIVGLIGNNGAGKTTLINVISGHLVPTEGVVNVYGRDLVPYGPEFRISFGLSRTFQDARLIPGLTVREILQSALSHGAPVGILAAVTAAPWVRHADRKARRRADEILEQFGLAQWADTRAEDLSTGVRRIVDIATQVAFSPKLVLLDEPAAGLSQREAEQFSPVLRRLVSELGCSVLIVEHDMPLMLSVADRIYCLELGKVIAEGAPAEIRQNPRVIASYLGSDGVAAARSGPVAEAAAAAPKVKVKRVKNVKDKATHAVAGAPRTRTSRSSATRSNGSIEARPRTSNGRIRTGDR